MTRHKAIFLVGETLLAARVLSAWLAAGHAVAEIWPGPFPVRRVRSRQRLLGLFHSKWTVARQVVEHRLKVQPHPRLADWPAAREIAKSSGADSFISAMSLSIVPPAILALFEGRAVNFHPALLPRYRGPSPRVGMLLDGTGGLYGGVSAHVMTEAIDAGAIVGQRAVPLADPSDLPGWEVQLAAAAGEVMTSDVLPYIEGVRTPIPQPANDAHYRRLAVNETTLGPGRTLADAERLLKLLGERGSVNAVANGRHYGVCRVTKILGDPTGDPPAVGFGSIVLDLADRRVRLSRHTEWHRFHNQRRMIEAISRLEQGEG